MRTLGVWLRNGGLVLAMVAVGAATTWGLSASRGDDAHPEADAGAIEGGWVDAGAALIRLDSAAARTEAHAMPGMQQNLADPIPEGFRRVAATVTVAAATDAGLRVRPGDFEVSGPQVPATPPTRTQLGDGVLADGAAITVVLVFDVPDVADDGLVLAYRGVEMPLPALGAAEAPAMPGAPSTGPSGEEHHGGTPSMPGPTPASVGPADDGHDHTH